MKAEQANFIAGRDVFASSPDERTCPDCGASEMCEVQTSTGTMTPMCQACGQIGKKYARFTVERVAMRVPPTVNRRQETLLVSMKRMLTQTRGDVDGS